MGFSLLFTLKAKRGLQLQNQPDAPSKGNKVLSGHREVNHSEKAHRKQQQNPYWWRRAVYLSRTTYLIGGSIIHQQLHALLRWFQQWQLELVDGAGVGAEILLQLTAADQVVLQAIALRRSEFVK